MLSVVTHTTDPGILRAEAYAILPVWCERAPLGMEATAALTVEKVFWSVIFHLADIERGPQFGRCHPRVIQELQASQLRQHRAAVGRCIADRVPRKRQAARKNQGEILFCLKCKTENDLRRLSCISKGSHGCSSCAVAGRCLADRAPRKSQAACRIDTISCIEHHTM